MNRVQCEAEKTEGGQCRVKNNVLPTDAGLRCVFHDPARKDEATAIQEKGREAARDRVRQVIAEADLPPLDTAEDAAEWASKLAAATATGKLDPKRAQQVVNFIKLFLDAKTKAFYEEQLKELRERLKKMGG